MNELLQLAGGFGAPGLLIAYMVWREKQQAERDKEWTAAILRVAETLATLNGRIK